jgi:hypothetical protein
LPDRILETLYLLLRRDAEDDDREDFARVGAEACPGVDECVAPETRFAEETRRAEAPFAALLVCAFAGAALLTSVFFPTGET